MNSIYKEVWSLLSTQLQTLEPVPYMVSKACREEKTKLVSDRAIRDLTDQLGAMDIDHEGGMQSSTI